MHMHTGGLHHVNISGLHDPNMGGLLGAAIDKKYPSGRGAQAFAEVTPTGCNKEMQRLPPRTSLQDARDLSQVKPTVDWHRHHITYEEMS